MEQGFNLDFDGHKQRAMVYEQEAKERLKKVLTDAGYSIVGQWRESLMFDYLIPSGHIEFCVKISGWGQSLEEKEAGA